MGTTNIPLTTLAPNQVIDSSVISALMQPVGTFTQFSLLVNRNVGAASLDTTLSASISCILEWSNDGAATWKPGLTDTVGGGIVWANKAQTIRQEQFGLIWSWPSAATHVRGSVVNGPVAVSVSGTATLS